ncbi:MAG: helix-turn-helix transcriptional regulator [Bacillota bacterium]
MGQVAARFVEAAGSCTGLGPLRSLLREAAAELGFDYFALVDHASLSGMKPGLVRIDNYPEGWAREFLAGGYAGDDPVHLASRRANCGFAWEDIPGLVRIGRRQRKILVGSRRHGIGPGFTVPANVPGEPSASCSFAVRAGRSLPRRRLHLAELIGAHALSSARRLRPRRGAARPRLSPREIQCMRLVARGKTDWEIARILGLSVETAHQYVKRARAAYDTVSRTQLVVYGLRDAWISFEDAIPPDG